MIIKLLLIILLLIPFEAHSSSLAEARRNEMRFEVMSAQIRELDMKIQLHKLFHSVMCDMLAADNKSVKANCKLFEPYMRVMK